MAPQAAVPPTAPKPAPKPLPEPGVVLGLSAAGVTALLGPPDYRRRDKPAEIWQYRRGGCTLDLFLYPGKDALGKDALAKVDHMEIRRPGNGRKETDKDKAGLSDRECFQGFVRRM